MRRFALLILALSLLTPESMMAQTKDQSIEAQLRAVFKTERVLRWEAPIRYQMLGITTPQHVNLFHATATNVAVWTGADFSRGTSSAEINVWFLFSPDFKQAARIDAVRNVMALPGENKEAFLKRADSWGDDTITYINRGIDEGKFRYVAMLINPLLFGEDSLQRLFLTTIFQSLTNVDHRSDELRPSVMNRGWKPMSRLQDVDIDLIRAIYDADYPYDPKRGGSLSQLIDRITQ